MAYEGADELIEDNPLYYLDSENDDPLLKEYAILEQKYKDQIQTLMIFAKIKIIKRLILEQYSEL